MEAYLTPLYSLEPLLEHAGGSIMRIDWFSIVAVVLVTAGQTMKSNNP